MKSLSKSHLKRAIQVSAVIICLLFTTLPVSAYQAEPFSDVPAAHWAYQYVSNMVRLNIISGYPDNTFKPDRFVSREEFAKFLCGATSLPLANPRTNSFSDVTSGDWSFRYVETVKDYLAGYPTSKGKPLFQGKMDATREDVAIALVKIKGFDKTTLPHPTLLDDMFKDTNTVSSQLKNLLAIAVEKKLIEGYPDNTIRASQSVTRAEAAALIDKANRIAGDLKDTALYNSAKLLTLNVELSKTAGVTGETLLAHAKGIYSNGSNRDITTEVNWSSSDSSIAAVTDDGQVFLNKEGNATLTAALDDLSDTAEISAVAKDSTKAEILKYIKISPEVKEISINESSDLKAEAVYENGKVVNITNEAKWECTDNGVAFVSSAGKVIGVGEGTALVKATYQDLTGTAGISVKKIQPSTVTGEVYSNPQAVLSYITISYSYKSLHKGEHLQLKALGSYANGSRKDISSLVAWSIDKPSIASISQRGEIYGISEGEAKVTATMAGKSFTMYLIVKKH